MLSPTDPRWHQLRTDYSAARKFLPALERLSSNPAEAPKIAEEFWSENYVCHQFTVYETTVAVVPHFINAAGRLPPENRRELLESAGFFALLLGVPLAASEQIRPPADVVEAYESSVVRARLLTAETLNGSWDEFQLARLMTAMAGFQGHQRLGILI